VYQLTVGSDDESAPVVRREHASITKPDGKVHQFTATAGVIERQSAELNLPRKVSSDRLVLPLALTMDDSFRLLRDALGGFSIYDYGLDKLAASQAFNPGERLGLEENSANLAVCLWHLKQHDPSRYERINVYLARMLDGVTVDVRQTEAGGVVMWFPTKIVGGQPKFFVAPYLVSDGTLRMTSILTALFQSSTRNGILSTIGIEEPESAVHPGVLPVILDAMIEASKFRQILVTTHSADLIDHDGLGIENIRFVDRIEGNTSIAPIDSVSKEAVRDRMYSLGDLLRLNQLSGTRP
jgi:hypothetical protein